MKNERLYLGVDGGGTRCRVRIANASGKVLGEAVGGGANTRLGVDHVFTEIISVASLALSNAGLDDSHLGNLHAGLGLAGLPLERDRKLAQSYPHPFASICFATDAYTACLGAHDGENGAILIVGTGTCGQAIMDDKELSVAGWGFEVSDLGSGARIGRNAIETSLLAHDGLAEKTDLTVAVMEKFENNPENIVVFAEKARPSDYGAFCPLVFEAEETGDQTATAIVNFAVNANLTILRRLVAFGAPHLTLMGGLADQMAKRMPVDIANLLVPAKYDAMHGAILLAKQHERAAA
ncbi:MULTISPECIES: BadF/BadG/BcrA/BcrD ATPase family protein [Thalassospira]|uniref:N-acetylglucosamine kinase n=2 Tax=Thalassospira TaxID=168934 RepID=A0A367VZ18_9PROT|nr:MULTISPECIES: BadF/BadG/BcrA/BcrD ATPase family protein [Thalassospira]MDG4721660.1 BadF/BadG/BcrA/BcrD ATPase family protein [Thalassospira sp. FZY0004]RCK31379.1 N-acetylglucosamine kinase [Thalassospira profundimaris]